MTKFQKSVRDALQSRGAVDRIILKRDGSIEARRTFYYRHGQRADLFASAIQSTLQSAAIVAHVEGDEVWRPYPQESYFAARIVPRVITHTEATHDVPR